MNQPENPLNSITTLKEGWAYFLETFREVIPKGDEYKFEGAWYAGAATYDTIIFNKINAANAAHDGEDGDLINLNITDSIKNMHREVKKFAVQRVKESSAAIDEQHQRN